MTTYAQTADDLTAALAALTTHGWTQFSWQAPDGQICPDGAMLLVLTGQANGQVNFYADGTDGIDATDRWDRYHAMRRALTVVMGDDNHLGWNDAAGRTWPEVKKVFQDAIKLVNYAATL